MCTSLFLPMSRPRLHYYLRDSRATPGSVGRYTITLSRSTRGLDLLVSDGPADGICDGVLAAAGAQDPIGCRGGKTSS